MVLIYSGISRNSSTISESFVENISTKSDLLNKSKLLAYKCKQIFESEGNLENIGDMLREAWDLKQKMNPKSIIPALSDLFTKAYKCGAIGGKVLGAGGGGFCLFWVDPHNRDLFIEKMKPSVYVPFKISYSGSTRIL
jgi:D-glycero-alpha-D-manno-heptose-7-phosphate kinase